ncbi:jg26156 [Pararge aegeria aegeria]|uniref:Jg26156 protein n=2 Tax=Pararge aegeria TaxID=116150 RepID=A0A8S4RY42_9NEOP|nr:jg26156 [Pararge aegeria aegeria]
MSALISYGFDGALQALLHDGTFVTVVTAWPDVTDKSVEANIGRIIGYLLWWVCMHRVYAVFVLFIITMGSLHYQFKNVQSYFCSLNDIFDEHDFSETGQENSERKYEEALKVGIHLHADTLWCTRQCQLVCSFVYSAQIIVNVAVMCVLMLQMVNSERTLASAFTIVLATVALLSSTGILMSNAGDITFEATLVPTAMYSSGWQNCRGERSRRVRKLMVIAMNEAQKPVIIRSFGIMEISYQSFVSMVKASYSAFSFLY